MSKISPRKLSLEDFPEQAKWIGPLFTVLNQFIQDVVTGSTNQFTVGDNLYQEIKEIKFLNSPNNFPLKFKTKFAVYPKGLFPISLVSNTLGEYSNNAPWVVWSYSDGQVIIKNISGLNSGETYTIRLLVIYE